MGNASLLFLLDPFVAVNTTDHGVLLDWLAGWGCFVVILPFLRSNPDGGTGEHMIGSLAFDAWDASMICLVPHVV